MMNSRRKPKITNVLEQLRSCIEHAQYFDTRHATDRQLERSVTRAEVLYVLKNGRHEKRKDRFQERYETWNYAVRGKTRDQRELRVVISFEQGVLLIITAIDLGGEYGKKN